MYHLYHVQGKEETKIEGINIYIDMSVEELKSEIIRVLNKDINIGQISLFVKQEKYLSYKNVYNYLTFNDTEELVKTNLNNYLKNIEGMSGQDDKDDKDSYTYEDLLDLSLDTNKIINMPLGLTVQKDTLSYPYIVNPYDWDLSEKLVNDEEMVIIQGLSKSALLSVGNIYMKNIYFVLEEEVLAYGNNDPLLKRIYFPDDNMLVDYTVDYGARETLDLLYSVHELYPDKLAYIEKGIKYLRCKYNTESISEIPLENIFKRLHAVASTPLIKYNPGKESDSILRLFSDKKSVSGDKLLYLKASVINSKVVIMAKQEGISIYIEHLNENNILIPILLDIDKTGVVYIDVNMRITMTLDMLEDMLKTVVNSEIENINVLLGSGGFNIPKLESLNTVEVINLTYCERVKINNSFDLFNLQCIPALFTVVESETSKDILMYYKRISNFNKRLAQRVLIIKLLAQSVSKAEIIKRLDYNYPGDGTILQTYKEILQEFTENANIKSFSEQGAGFPVSIKVINDGQIKESLILEITNIDNLQYLDIIPKWLYGTILLTQNIPEMKPLLAICNREPEEEVVPDEVEPAEEEEEEVVPDEVEPAEEEEEEVVQDEVAPAEEEEEEVVPDEVAPAEEEEEEVVPDEVAPAEEEEVKPAEEEEEEEVPGSLSYDSDLELGDPDTESSSEEETDNMSDDKIEPGSPADDSDLELADSDPETDPETDSDRPKSPDEGGGEDDMEYRSIDEEERKTIKLKNPNYFLDRLQRSDPKLFEKANKQNKHIKGYTRICPGNYQRHPVVLTPEEKENIDNHDETIDKKDEVLRKKLKKDYPDETIKEEDYKSYGSSVKYGYNPKKPYYYICPQFWCIPENRSISKVALMKGECGGWDVSNNRPTANITSKANTTEKEKVYERKQAYFLDKSTKEYKGAYPGFLGEKAHSKGKDVCVPCCFVNKKDPKSQISRIEDCNQETKTKTKTVLKAKPDTYVLDANKMPLDEGRWGLLPDSIHNLLMENKEECKLVMNHIEHNKPCLLRYGVSQQNMNQSFLSCIADISEIPNLKKRIIESINIDNFITYSNGNLIQEFIRADYAQADPAQYNKSDLYKQLGNKDPDFLSRVYSAMDNFKNYILADTVVIDHTYLWDVISLPNKGLFKRGVNIIIIEENGENVEMVCPSSYAGRKLYDKMNASIILIKKGNIYEPVYHYLFTGTTIKTIKQFLPYHKKLAFKIEQTNKYLTHCIPEDSKTKIYPFSENILLQTLIIKLRTHKGPKIHYLCIDFNGKTVGMHVSYKKRSGFIPCYPSAINTSFKLKMIYENEWQSYDKTTAFLEVIKELDTTILCKPTILIEDSDDDGKYVIGLLTETNQFIKIEPPEKVESDLTRVTGSDYIDQEKAIFNSTTESGVNKTNDLYLEQQFYNVFRSIVREEINQPTNKSLRKYIVDIISKYNQDRLYDPDTLDRLGTILHTLVDHKIWFITYESDILNSLNTISTCSASCSENYCLTTDEGECKLLLPEYNLINQLENNTVYFTKMADQILRYTRIQQFILNPNKYLNLSNINYEVNEDEKLLLSSKLNGYLTHIKNIEELDTNRYIRNNAYDNMNPPASKKIKTLPYYIADDNIKRLDKASSTKFKKINLMK